MLRSSTAAVRAPSWLPSASIAAVLLATNRGILRVVLIRSGAVAVALAAGLRSRCSLLLVRIGFEQNHDDIHRAFTEQIMDDFLSVGAVAV